MSYKIDLSDLERGAATSLTQQLVGRIAALIDGGELEPGARLPTTRALAEDAGINHLTAARVYRRLAELGYVTAVVGRGTFVRTHPPAAAGPADDSWQLGRLLPRRQTYTEQMLRESLVAGPGGEIALAAGFPDPELSPGPELADIAALLGRESPHLITDHLDVEGLPALRERVAQHGRAHGFARSADEILIVSGARQGIDLVTRALLGPGDAVAVESPTFTGMLASLQASGARVLALPVDEHGADVDELERLLARHEIKLVALQSSCQNPTGADLSPGRRQRLLELARERGFFVLEDGVYATLRYSGEERPRLRAEAPSHVIYVDSLSKTVGAGLRVGWIAASGPILDRLVQLKLDTDIHTSALPQHLLARYLEGDEHDRLIERAIPFYRRRRDALVRALERHVAADATWTVPPGGHHVWLTLRRPVDERELYAAALRCGVSYLPGGAVQAEHSSPPSLRLSFSRVPEDAYDEAMRRLATALREVSRRPRAASTSALS